MHPCALGSKRVGSLLCFLIAGVREESSGRSKWLGSFFAMAHCARRSCQGGQIFGFTKASIGN